MDFTGRGSQPAQPASGQVSGSSAPAGGSSKKGKNKRAGLSKWGVGVFGLLVLVLVASALVLLGVGGKKTTEASFVDESKLQAVFLQTGQVYFGNVSEMNRDFFVLNNIYYLQTSTSGAATDATAADTNVSLVKLGCELHSPFDTMVINRDQVTFWENLQGDGQVAKAVETFQQENPDGQQCVDQSAAPNTDSGVQPTGTTGESADTSGN